MFSDISNSDDRSTSQSHVNIVILGSSTAEGAGATKLENSWVFKLEHELKILNNSSRVVNFGKSGYSTFHILPNEQFMSIPGKWIPSLLEYTSIPEDENTRAFISSHVASLIGDELIRWYPATACLK